MRNNRHEVLVTLVAWGHLDHQAAQKCLISLVKMERKIDAFLFMGRGNNDHCHKLGPNNNEKKHLGYHTMTTASQIKDNRFQVLTCTADVGTQITNFALKT